jgi:hypothetical protein
MADDPSYGAFECYPARFTDYEAWVYQHDNVWREMDPADVTQHAGVMSEACYHANCANVPALPTIAFTANKTAQTPSGATTPSNTSSRFREARPDEYGQSYVIGGQGVSPPPTTPPETTSGLDLISLQPKDTKLNSGDAIVIDRNRANRGAPETLHYQAP